MKWPFVSVRVAELLERELQFERLRHQETRNELARQREVNEAALRDALTAAGSRTPTEQSRQDPLPRPVSRRTAAEIIANIERSRLAIARSEMKEDGTSAATASTAAAS